MMSLLEIVLKTELTKMDIWKMIDFEQEFSKNKKKKKKNLFTKKND